MLLFLKLGKLSSLIGGTQAKYLFILIFYQNAATKIRKVKIDCGK
ncbi:hypothetical protein HMPREF9444_00681 [Succinatimonas hippei YIT 12066]|uniref:Uncharacterized protein n=1 Tax=Succinatimonas hippei (strain DSM 22608 / JCM 16073 / KCTC 15190 / YIT 12066) TaxID=762983 RepID=E8LJ08_SUCHY|nr:hypothetical protein HMPREF9444_00681 [Succinatimonas hippei YIT 12066]